MTESRLTYLDASALMRWAEGTCSETTERNKLIRPMVSELIDAPSRTVGCSEFTLMEFHSNLTNNWRGGHKFFDETWWHTSRDDVLERIRTGSLLVLPTPPKIMEEAMAIVTVGTRDYGDPVGSWDAVHMLIANRWAFQETSEVDVITSDKHFEFVARHAGFSKLLNVLNLDVLASTGFGADKARRRP